MKKFRFRLATVLDVRKQSEQNALVALGDAQRAHAEAVARKQGLERELQASLLRRERLGAEATPALSFRIEQEYITGTKQRIERAQGAIHRAARGVEKALRAYLAAKRQTRQIETIEDNDRREFRAEQARKERKQMDELVVMRSRLREETA